MTDEYSELRPLFDRLREPDVSDDERAALRERLIAGHAPIAEHIARRFRGRGPRDEDLVQVALVGLIGAVDRFDPSLGTDFLPYAVPTITGEIRRHFRDTTWAVHVPRRIKERSVQINKAVTDLSARLGRSPRPKEIAAELDIDVEQVYEGLQAGYAYHSETLETTDSETGAPTGIEAQLGQVDKGFGHVEDRELVATALAALPEREARIVLMRFGENLSQSQIAQRLGLSQVHISRLLAASLSTMRQALANDEADTPQHTDTR